MNYTVKTTAFEGPLDVLLGLIEKRKLLINDVSLSSVADDFIVYVNQHEKFPLSQAAHFILVASTLLLIKSKSLLPVLTLSDEEQADVDDLQLRLKLHQLFMQRAEIIAGMFHTAPLFFPERDRIIDPLFSPHDSMTLVALHEAMQRVIAALPKRADTLVTATVRKVISLEEMIVRLSDRITKALRVQFQDFSGGKTADKFDVIMSFLAMLELVKQGVITVNQEAHFSDILMEHDQVTTPRYG